MSITAKALAIELGKDRSIISRCIKRLEIPHDVVRGDRGSRAHAISDYDADRVREYFQEGTMLGSETPESSHGYFYVILLFPELSNNIVKLGFSIDLERRLQEHRTLVPMLELIGSWPCKRVWEQTAIDSVTRIGCKQLGPEVFDCANVDGLLSDCDTFFECLPTLED